ncbi:limonene-1,2-epoxide hydrolase family protein [Cycloclasticus sp.]|jgi:limonene-1,2-epoxide hydrolase|uniref:limonene-1,2-epoxide hydrolase family protein n=1 Tax=Cycloclasticus sp. TaxID=2024830 RepID=UPI000C0E19C9|nr:limonene-1,2-epoxide hydrolase family protein [Cycloclasticus sp.]PHR50994.1 MAG: limonene-1,2-epoxide hydrolase [Cycloclasticus sp.]
MLVTNNEETVKRFCEAWDEMDQDTILSLMSDDAVYHNLPLGPLKGCQQIADSVEGFLKMTASTEFKILTLVADGKRVVTERVDTFAFKDGSMMKELPVLGIFEFDNNGKISSWREYWDMQDWLKRGGPVL